MEIIIGLIVAFIAVIWLFAFIYHKLDAAGEWYDIPAIITVIIVELVIVATIIVKLFTMGNQANMTMLEIGDVRQVQLAEYHTELQRIFAKAPSREILGNPEPFKRECKIAFNRIFNR